jgi:phage-related protein
MVTLPAARKPVRWVGSSRKDYADFPDLVQQTFGFELFLLQAGEFPPSGKWLKGLNGIVELIEDHDGDTYRAVCTVRFAAAVYVLHASKRNRRGELRHLGSIWSSLDAALAWPREMMPRHEKVAHDR